MLERHLKRLDACLNWKLTSRTRDGLNKILCQKINSWSFVIVGINLRKPNKRFSVNKKELIERLHDYLKNIWQLRQFFIEQYDVDPPTINGNRMPLHRNESSQQKTLSFKGEDTFVEENYMLFRDRVTVFTQVSSEKNIILDPEFVFKGKGTRTKAAVADRVNYQ